MKIAVVGLGKIGTALAAQYASMGHHVFGCDINARTVERINVGRLPVGDEPGVQGLLEAASADGRLTATTDTAMAVRSCDVVVVAVPLLVDDAKRPDYRAIDAATHDIARGLRAGALVSYETTLPVGDCRTHFGPLLEEGTGLRAGRDFHLAFSPERVKSGQMLRDLATYPKVVGGVNEQSTAVAVTFYKQVLPAPILAVSSTEIAEFVKLAASFYRDVNIALANELAMCADACGVDIVEAIDIANTDPTSHLHQPGIGVGGHCIPVYPYFFIDRFATTTLLRAARSINDGMAAYSVQRLDDEIGPLAGKIVVVLGLAFRANVKEATFSMAHLVIGELERRGATARVHDPLFTADEISALGLQPADTTDVFRADAIIIQSFHEQYDALDFGRLTARQVIVDGRHAIDDDVIAALHCRYIGLGRAAIEKDSISMGTGAKDACARLALVTERV